MAVIHGCGSWLSGLMVLLCTVRRAAVWHPLQKKPFSQVADQRQADELPPGVALEIAFYANMVLMVRPRPCPRAVRVRVCTCVAKEAISFR